MTEVGSGILELGKRLGARRKEAGFDAASLGERAQVPPMAIEQFERGKGGLGLAALGRLASALGVPPSTFVHTKAPPGRALTEPTILLRRSGTGSLPDADREALSAALVRARSFSLLGQLLATERLGDAFAPAPAPSEKPYLAGYACARRARQLLPARAAGPIRELSRLLESRFDVLVIRHAFASPVILGASCRSGEARVVAVSAGLRSETYRRFVLAHELGHQLLDLSEEGATVDEGSVEGIGFWLENPPEEKRANAFSAMFLAPEEAVRTELGEPRPEGYGLADARALVTRARRSFGLGFAATAWHLFNLRYLRSEDTVRALLTSPDADDVTGFESDTPYDGLSRRVFEAREREAISERRATELLGAEFEAPAAAEW